MQMDRTFILMKKNGPGGLSVPASGLYTFIFKLHSSIFSEITQPIKTKFHM